MNFGVLMKFEPPKAELPLAPDAVYEVTTVGFQHKPCDICTLPFKPVQANQKYCCEDCKRVGAAKYKVAANRNKAKHRKAQRLLRNPPVCKTCREPYERTAPAQKYCQNCKQVVGPLLLKRRS